MRPIAAMRCHRNFRICDALVGASSQKKKTKCIGAAIRSLVVQARSTTQTNTRRDFTLIQLYVRNFNTVASPTKPPRMITGRRTRPRSRNTAIQKSKLDLKLVKIEIKNRSQYRAAQFSFCLVRLKRSGGWISYLMTRRTRLFSMSYTPSCRVSFLQRRTGPSSGSTHGQPLVVGSGSVAARKMAPTTRSTGVHGMPAVRTFVFQLMMLVSAADDQDMRCKSGEGRKGKALLTCEPWMDARRPDVFAVHDGI